MAGNGSEGLGDDFFEQILAVPDASAYGSSSSSRTVVGGGGGGGGDVGSMPMVLQLGFTTTSVGNGVSNLRGGSLGMGMGLPLGLNLEQAGFLRHHQDHAGVAEVDVDVDVEAATITNNHQHQHQHLLRLNNKNNSNNNNSTSSSSSSTAGITERDSMQQQQQQHRHRQMFGGGFGQIHTPTHAHPLRPTLPSPPQPQPQLLHYHQHQPFQNQAPGPVATMPQPPGIRPRVRARRGQATDPHSIAERLRRERIAERMKALQELVPSINKTDRAAMLDEIVDYVKFLRLQVKVLSMSRLGGAGAVAQLVADVPLSAVEGEDTEGGGGNQQAWEKWSNDGTEQQVAKLMEEDVGAAMQLLQSKALCIMPISLASAIFRMPQSESSTLIKPESNSHS